MEVSSTVSGFSQRRLEYRFLDRKQSLSLRDATSEERNALLSVIDAGSLLSRFVRGTVTPRL